MVSKSRKSSRSPKSVKEIDTSSLQTFLDSLGVTRPIIHVNGPNHPTAVITVDLGAPLIPVRLNQENAQELISRLRKLTRSFYSDDANIRVSSDSPNGIFWSSVA